MGRGGNARPGSQELEQDTNRLWRALQTVPGSNCLLDKEIERHRRREEIECFLEAEAQQGLQGEPTLDSTHRGAVGQGHKGTGDSRLTCTEGPVHTAAP